MKRKNTTRNALLTSIISMLLCVSMLVGATFAWFTDEVKSGINVIAAGNLDIDVTNADGDSIEDLETLFNDVTLWEPGAVAYEKLTISNEGSLALKYAMSFAWDQENHLNGHKLSDVLKVAVLEANVVAGLNMENRDAVLAAAKAATCGDLKTFSINGSLYPTENAAAGEYTERVIHVVIYWEPSVLDNLYNANNGQQTSDGEALHIDLGVVVKATQQMKEEDSFGNDYDERAEYPQNTWLGDATYDWYNNPEGNTYTLTYASDLAGFANIVNGTAPSTIARSGYLPADSFEGKTVKLADSIDLNDLAWTPIGANGNFFAGTFDGNGKTIYNLNVNTAKQAGLFANVRGKLKNVTIHGASIRATDYAGALLGQGYAYIDNCHVINADVIVTPTWDAAKNLYDGGAKAGGLVGQLYEGGMTLTNSSATNVNVRGYRDVGGLLGMAHYGNTVSGNAVESVTVSYISAEGYAPYADGKLNENISVLAGRIHANVKVVENNTYEGALLIHTVDELKDAFANGGKFALAKDLALTETITLANGTAVELDLNDCTIAGSNSATATHNDMFLVKGNLTVKDGTVTFTHGAANMGWNGATNVFNVTAGGVLNVVNATVENLGGTDMNFGIHLNNWGEVTLNVENSTIKSTYCAVRVFNSGPNMNNVTINNSTLYSAGNRAFWVHNYASADFSGKLWSSSAEAYDEAKVAARLNFNIFGNGNTFAAETNTNGGVIRYGFNNTIYYTTDGAQVVKSADALVGALKSGEDVVLTGSLTNVAVNTTAPYGNYYGVALNGGVLDGNGNTLDFDIGELKNGKADNYGIMASGGTIKNVTITGVFRGIMIMNPTENIYIDNVIIGDEDVCYAINTGEGDGTHSLYVTNSTIKGWSSYGTAIKDVYFTNCTFAQGEYYTDVFGRLVKPYVDTVFENCEFNSKFYIDLSQLGKDGDGNVLNENTKIVLKNCTVNGVKLTADNWQQLIVAEGDCGEGQISIEAKNGTYMTTANILDYVVIQ